MSGRHSAVLGTHDELVERDGYYADIAERQSLKAEILT